MHVLTDHAAIRFTPRYVQPTLASMRQDRLSAIAAGATHELIRRRDVTELDRRSMSLVGCRLEHERADLVTVADHREAHAERRERELTVATRR